jgi:hypothetical protein
MESNTMSQLEDTRPHVFTEADSELDDHLDADARRGQIVDGEPACPSCHVHGDQPHTDYCQVAGEETSLECGCPNSGTQSHPCTDPERHHP